MSPKLSRAGADRAWVAGQYSLIALVVVAAFLGPRWPARSVLSGVGLALVVMGGVVMLWGGRTLGHALTSFPSPRGIHLERGPYGFVRHPIYSGGIALAVGVALASGPVALIPVLALVLFLLAKSRYEERLLLEADSSYAEYRKRVRQRLFPGLL
jgi:protein-S-isoprenylcysteine O-methyltransferase Ste14